PDEDRQRIVEGVHLIERGLVDYLILAMRDTGLSWKTILRIYGIETDIPGERILIGRPEQVNSTVLKYCGGTFGEAAAAVGLMRANSLNSAVVVSSRYHIPRVRLAFGNLNSKGSLDFSYRPVGEPETGKLLSSAYALAKRLTEYGKFFTAFFVYPIGAKIIENDRCAAGMVKNARP
ncbi:MAG TPA: ElyC/SanA/YdcF family protein, partial [Syntrophobacteraceae bacterium]|nr:ElyC/SanA/YdcF family protein [Deltaproteobacteria bacterium]HQN19749.1 ElyC/SanA/YdcF family protein [Syntrophobacteraceae bacterium]